MRASGRAGSVGIHEAGLDALQRYTSNPQREPALEASNTISSPVLHHAVKPPLVGTRRALCCALVVQLQPHFGQFERVAEDDRHTTCECGHPKLRDQRRWPRVVLPPYHRQALWPSFSQLFPNTRVSVGRWPVPDDRPRRAPTELYGKANGGPAPGRGRGLQGESIVPSVNLVHSYRVLYQIIV